MISNLIVAATLLVNSLSILNFKMSYESNFSAQPSLNLSELSQTETEEKTVISSDLASKKSQKCKQNKNFYYGSKDKPEIDYESMSNLQKGVIELLSPFRHMRLVIAVWNLFIMFCMIFLFGQ